MKAFSAILLYNLGTYIQYIMYVLPREREREGATYNNLYTCSTSRGKRAKYTVPIMTRYM